MELTTFLFPRMKNFVNNKRIPYLEDKDSPWSILDDNNQYSLSKQIKQLDNNGINSKYRNISLDQTKGQIVIDSSAIIDDYVRIEGPAFIGKNTHIRHSAYIRSGTWISDNCVIGHCSEVKNSLFLPDSKAPHFNYVGDSILGFGVNLGAGTKISNVRNDKREILITNQYGNKINTKLKKFGALIGDCVEIGCNTVTNPGTIISPKTSIIPNSTLKGWNE